MTKTLKKEYFDWPLNFIVFVNRYQFICYSLYTNIIILLPIYLQKQIHTRTIHHDSNVFNIKFYAAA